MLMTVKEYAKLRGRSIPLIYKEIRQNKLNTDNKYGRILIKVPKSKLDERKA